MGKPWENEDLDLSFLVNIQKTDGKIAMLQMEKSTISMTIFNSYVTLPEGKTGNCPVRKLF